MSLAPTNVCPICGFADCETISQKLAADPSAARNIQPKATQLIDQSRSIDSAADLLVKSESVLICGLDCLDSAAQMAAWRLADLTHAILDSSLGKKSHAATQVVQRRGNVAATYGQVRNRSDLLVFWDCDLHSKHACLLRLLTANPTNGRVPNRKMVFVGAGNSPMAQLADIAFAVDNAKNRNPMVRLICRLRALVAGRPLPDDYYSDRDLPFNKVQELFGFLQHASYGSLFYACHEPDWEFDFEIDSLLQLVSECNAQTPLVGIRIRDDANGLGAETVMSLASGFPAAISLQRGHAFSSGALYSTLEVLRRSTCDTILLCGNTDDGVSHSIPEWLKDKLQQMTVIQLAPRSETFADLFIACPTVEFGRVFAGDVFRADGVMLSSAFPDAGLSAEKILTLLASACQKILN